MFIDEVIIDVTGGKGGDGIAAFRREYRVDKGGPFGGSGGRGGHVILIAKEGLSTLLDFRFNHNIKGKAGDKGRTKGQTGGMADDSYIACPVGTIVYDFETNSVIADLSNHNDEVILAHGGRGGRGNMSFATGSNKAPNICEKGEPGEYRKLRLELKILADCGLVGFPSVGKSTIISVVSNARPKIAPYHFTTLIPNLGMVRIGEDKSFVMADLPGLIEGAHQGLGLGLQFLRHIERCRVIVHVIDIAKTEKRDPYNDYLVIRKELESYNLNLLERPEIIVCNKLDEPNAMENLIEFKKHFPDDKIILGISAYTGYQTTEMCYKISEVLEKTPNFSLFSDQEMYKEYIFNAKDPFEITKDNDTYNITGDGIKRLFLMTDFNNDDNIRRFARQLRFLGIDNELRKMGIKNGDTVKIFEYEFEFIE